MTSAILLQTMAIAGAMLVALAAMDAVAERVTRRGFRAVVFFAILMGYAVGLTYLLGGRAALLAL